MESERMDMDDGKSGEVRLEELYTRYKGLLFGLAYRMTGSAADAEDLVQDVFVQLRLAPLGSIRNMKAYLCKILTNRCLDLMKSARIRKEQYVGPWLPEPLPDMEAEEPAEIYVRKETVTYAVLTLLEMLNPVERAVFVLREAFGFEYTDIAVILGKSEANCRKLLSRVKPKLELTESREAPSAGNAAFAFTEAFLAAAANGNMDSFVRLLAEDAVLYSDGGGKVRSAVRPIYGRHRILAFFAGLHRKAAAWGLSVTVSRIRFNGEEGLQLHTGPLLYGIIGFYSREPDHISAIYLQRNPDKLGRFSGETVMA
jgi:RNA polymerase sigma-70 factor, ECF subfamily